MERDLAQKREVIANTLGQDEIWKEVVNNALNMNADIEMKADILLSAISDLAVIYKFLKRSYNEGKIRDNEYALLLERCIDKIESRREDREFNPLEMNDQDN